MGERTLWGGPYVIQTNEDEGERVLQQLSCSAIWTNRDGPMETVETSTEACTVENHDAVHEDRGTDQERSEGQVGKD